MGDSVGDPAPGSAPQGNGGTSLSVITEGVGELAVIDPEVAKKACEEVLEKVKLMHSVSSDSLTKAADGSEAERAPRTAVDLPNGDVVEGCEIRCLDDLPSTASKIQEEDETTANTVKTARKRQKNNSAKQSWLLRLFESKLFDISMAISYLYNSKEPGVQAYIGNRLFCFRNEEVDFYLPQLLNMYIHMDEDVGDAIKPYIVHRCRQSINFSLQCALLLGAYSSDMHISTQRHSRGTKLRKLILSDELKPAHKKRELPSLSPAPDMGLSPSKRTHQRSKSDATVTISLSSNLKRTASNPKVESEEEVMVGLSETRPGRGCPQGRARGLVLISWLLCCRIAVRVAAKEALMPLSFSELAVKFTRGRAVGPALVCSVLAQAGVGAGGSEAPRSPPIPSRSPPRPHSLSLPRRALPAGITREGGAGRVSLKFHFHRKPGSRRRCFHLEARRHFVSVGVPLLWFRSRKLRL